MVLYHKGMILSLLMDPRKFEVEGRGDEGIIFLDADVPYPISHTPEPIHNICRGRVMAAARRK